MAVDPLAALRVWSVDVDIVGHTFTIPPLPATAWFEAVLSTQVPLPIIPGMMDQDAQDAITDLLLDGAVTADELVDKSREVLEVAAGRPWWEADRLIRSAGEYWDTIGGELIRLGVSLDDKSLAAVLNAIYVICTRNMDEKQLNKFQTDLRTPPLGVVPTSEANEMAAQQAFAALMAQSRPPGT